MSVTEAPWANTDDDIAAITATISTILNMFESDPLVTMISPSSGESAAEFVATYKGSRGSSHWLGTAKMGIENGELFLGLRGDVVDTRARVYGTENLVSVAPG
jgi:cellobiose dehydrogenase (acceptor)